MKYYIQVRNDEIISKGQVTILNDDVTNIEVAQDVYDNIEQYIYQDGELILDPDYEEKQAQKERERIGQLKVTKRVFALALQQYGITYTQLKTLIATNEQAQLEWDLCVELERNNPLLDIMALQMGVTSEQLDYIFQKANGEDVEAPVVEENVESSES